MAAWLRPHPGVRKGFLSGLPLPPVCDPLPALLAEVRDALKGLKADKVPALLLSFRTAAKLLKVDRATTLNALVDSGQLAVTMVNGKPRIQRSEIDRLAVEGFDRDAPKKKAPRKTSPTTIPKAHPTALKSAIMGLKI